MSNGTASEHALARGAVILVSLLAFVASLVYLTLNPRLLGGPSGTRVSMDVDISDGWVDDAGNEVSLGNLNAVPDFRENGIRVHRKLPGYIESGIELNFLSKNARVHLLYNMDEVYAYDPDEEVYGQPYGSHFNFAPLSHFDTFKTATLIIQPVYPQSATQILDVRLSGTAAYIQRYVRNHAFAFALSLTIVFIGIATIGMRFAMRNVEHGELDLFSLGALTILLGAWSGAETLVPQLTTGLGSLITALDYLGLLFAPYPIVRFAGSLARPPHRKLYTQIAFASAVLAVGSTMLLAATQGTNMHELLVISHVQLVISAVLLAAQIAESYRAHKLGHARNILRTNRLLLTGFGLFVCGATADFVIFNVTGHAVNDSAFFMRLGLFVLSVILSIQAFLASISYMQRANRAEAIEQVAYTDALTGIGNRTAWHNMRDELDAALADGTLPDVLVCQFDVNYLKQVNDAQGHAAGDAYLQAIASTINRSFGTEGSCYRTGGDEFTAVIAGISLPERLDLCEYLLEMSLGEQRQRSDELPLSIARGYARVSETSERTMDAAQKLADDRMYANKRAMKAERTV